MTYISRYRINATVTATGGAAQSFFAGPVQNGGYLDAIRYRRGTTGSSANGFATGAHLAITCEESGLDILSCTATDDSVWYPRAQVVSTAGVALSYTSGAAPPGIPTRIPVGQERIKITVSSAGAASAGPLRAVFDLYVEGV